MLVRGVRRSWEMARSRFARHFFFVCLHKKLVVLCNDSCLLLHMGGGSAGADGDGQHTQKGDGVACTVYGKGKIGSCKIIIGKK